MEQRGSLIDHILVWGVIAVSPINCSAIRIIALKFKPAVIKGPGEIKSALPPK